MKLYRHAFILRRRIRYVDGFPVGDPEITLKFRHPDVKQAAATNVRRISMAPIESSSKRRLFR
jgi:hypothetical protein